MIITRTLLPLIFVLQSFSAASAATPAKPAYLGAPYAPGPHPVSAKQLESLGRQLFFDRSLSASGSMSCASCHSPAHAYGPPNGLAVQLGGKDGKQAGTRAVPSLRYLQSVPAFSEHFHDDDGNDSEDAGPTGGFTWDGRADSTHSQAALPLLAANEMANGTPAAVVKKLQASRTADSFRQLFGKDIFSHPDTAFGKAVLALEVFQQNPKEFSPYDSKYDAYLRGQLKLSTQEARGLKAFNDPAKGNCASCHLSQRSESGAFPLFSDFGHIAVGAPRNPAIAANRDPAYHDLGLCGPYRTDLKNHAEYCGLFRTPSLRNVATRRVFFHNGAFHDLRQVLRFYAERDTHPEKWYPRGKNGKTAKFDDLPARYHGNINMEPPFGGKPGGKPAFTEQDIDDMLAFLKTLNDGYQSAKRQKS
ncbi:cytochrome-c peroxidase [Chromobacterium alticapitis]|uniref:Cytochrome-c peroxidase n=1 Tax=Chromobacterium alticapitis TaxID=2073169 RepID=A0A2S5DI08_9NEIS|nr:cytochrome c peroxidase [Chromobacterium alticapitis]POZ62725.1 cytochrome-c peroxidase [Chromobacterium alticapitis]